MLEEPPIDDDAPVVGCWSLSLPPQAVSKTKEITRPEAISERFMLLAFRLDVVPSNEVRHRNEATCLHSHEL